jgi:hypothetical protein
MSKNRALLLLPVLLSGCLSDVVALKPNAANIKVVHETDKPLRCEVLGKINGMSRSSDAKEGRNGAENDFRNHAAELKANFALIEAERSGQVGTSSQKDYFLGGKALQCQTEEMEEAQEKKEAEAREAREKAAEEQKQKEEAEKKEAKAAKTKAKK